MRIKAHFIIIFFIKSYYSQLFLALGFGLAAVSIAVAGASTNMVLKGSYWAGAMFPGLYFFIGWPDPLN